MKAGLVSLGCAKNLVDSEFILGMLSASGVEIVSDPETADVIIVNTCGFIGSAKQETLDTIREMDQYGKKLVVTGCYAQRYRDRLLQEMPAIDRIVTLQEYPRIHQILYEVFQDPGLKFYPLKYENRMLSGSKYTPYVKISEGCDNHCAYCAIPLIRGRFQSRDFDEIMDECRLLVRNGAKEINLIGQDTTRYGSDLPTGKRLEDLLEAITEIEDVFLVRVLYLYPDEITDRLLETMRDNPKIAKYFDIPIQHISSSVLKRMNRRGDESFLKSLFAKIRNMMPEAIFRTTLIVGFPGESEDDFQKLLDFITEYPFHRLGAFTYSREEDTKAYSYPEQIPGAISTDRYDRLMKQQKKLARRLNRAEIGKLHQAIVEAHDPESGFYYGRSYAFAPDDIDGYIVFQSRKELSVGDIAQVLIKEAIGYDLIGDAIDHEVK